MVLQSTRFFSPEPGFILASRASYLTALSEMEILAQIPLLCTTQKGHNGRKCKTNKPGGSQWNKFTVCKSSRTPTHTCMPSPLTPTIALVDTFMQSWSCFRLIVPALMCVLIFPWFLPQVFSNAYDSLLSTHPWEAINVEAMNSPGDNLQGMETGNNCQLLLPCIPLVKNAVVYGFLLRTTELVGLDTSCLPQ